MPRPAMSSESPLDFQPENGRKRAPESHFRPADSRFSDFMESLQRSDLPYNHSMNQPTQAELDAKLATIEAKMDGRLARIEDRFSSIDRQFSDMRSILAEQKNAAWKAAGATIGVFVAVFAIYVASFDSGRETAKMAADAKQEAAAALTEMRQIVRDLKSTQAPQAQAAQGASAPAQPAK